jgi:hypothetical protein
MTDVNKIASRYIDLWNERTPSRRREILQQHWANDAKYIDPLMSGDGHDGVDALIAGVQQRFPDFRFHLIGEPNGFGDHLRFSWGLGPEGADSPIKGTDSPWSRMDASGASPDFSIRSRETLDQWQCDCPGSPGQSCSPHAPGMLMALNFGADSHI